MKVRVITAIVGIIAVLCLVWLGGWFLTGAVFLVPSSPWRSMTACCGSFPSAFIAFPRPLP